MLDKKHFIECLQRAIDNNNRELNKLVPKEETALKISGKIKAYETVLYWIESKQMDVK